MNITFSLNDKKSIEDKKIKVKSTNKKKIQNTLLLDSLIKFYKKKNNIKLITDIVNGNGSSNTSLRLIDWFVTNYSKKKSVYVSRVNCKDNEQINVYTDYRSQLKAYSKQLFDPFRRGDRINFYFNTTEYINSTVGQLNFFRWAIESNILVYIEANFSEIEKDMIDSQKKNQEKKNDKENLKVKVTTNDSGKEIITVRKKRNELSKAKSKKLTYNNNRRVISFE
jgi:hypothetical protein